MRHGLRGLTLPLLALVAFTLIPQFYLRPYWSTALAFVFVGYRFAIEWFQLRLPPRGLLWLAQVAVAAAIWQHYRSIFGDEAAGTLLTLLTCLKVYELRTARDYFVTASLCFLVLMTFLLLNQSLFISIFMAVNGILITAFLYALERGSWDANSWRRDLRATFGLFLKTAPLLVLSFLLFPRFSTGFGTGADTGSKTGITDRLQPGSVADLVASDELVFRASYNNGIVPPKNLLYWRGAVLDVSKGLNWERRTDSGQRVIRREGRADIEVILETGFDKFLLAPENAAHVFFTSLYRRPVLRAGRIFELDRPLKVRERYFIETFSEAKKEELADPAPYLQVADEPTARMRELLGNIKGGSAPETVRRLLHHFSNQGYAYTLQPPRVPNLDVFLFDTKTGFCEHFAGAMATLLRHAGVPSRIVVGFQGGTHSFLENYVTVRAHDAHAWVEYYDATEWRWRRVDPTAQVAPLRLSLGSDSYMQSSGFAKWFGIETAYYQLRALIDEVDASWVGFLVRFDLNRQKEILASFGMEAAIFDALPLFLLLSIILVLAVLYFLEAQGREPLSPVERLYRDLLRQLRRRRFEKAANEGPLSLFTRLKATDAPLAARVLPILETLTRVRYGGQELTPQDRLRVSRAIRDLRA